MHRLTMDNHTLRGPLSHPLCGTWHSWIGELILGNHTMRGPLSLRVPICTTEETSKGETKVSMHIQRMVLMRLIVWTLYNSIVRMIPDQRVAGSPRSRLVCRHGSIGRAIP